jgi:hypothetical protein
LPTTIFPNSVPSLTKFGGQIVKLNLFAATAASAALLLSASAAPAATLYFEQWLPNTVMGANQIQGGFIIGDDGNIYGDNTAVVGPGGCSVGTCGLTVGNNVVQLLNASPSTGGLLGEFSPGLNVVGINSFTGSNVQPLSGGLTTSAQVVNGTVYLQQWLPNTIIGSSQISGYFILGADGTLYADGTSVVGPGGCSVGTCGLTVANNVVQLLNASPSTGGLLGEFSPGLNVVGINSFTGSNVQPLSGGITTSVFAVAAAVPEPGAWALMLGGFGLAGASLRRRRRLMAA